MKSSMRTLFAALVAVLLLTGQSVAQQNVSEQKKEPPLRHQPAPAVLNSTYKESHKHVSDTYIGKLPAEWEAWLNRFDGKLNSRGELRAVLDVMLSAPADQQLFLLSEKEVELYNARPVSGFVGMGAVFSMVQKLDDGFPVQKVLADSPAHTAGIRSGGLIVAIDGQKLVGLEYPEALRILTKGKDQTVLTIREGDKEIDYTVTRKDGKLGIEFRPGKTTFSVKVSQVYDGSPAQAAGVVVGDVVSHVNTNQIANADADWFLSQATYGKLGTTIGLTVVRDGKPVELNIKRAIVVNEELSYSFSSDDQGSTLRLTNFDWSNIAQAVDRHISAIGQRECTIDLRGASGDNEDLAARVAARFIAEGEVLKLRKRDKAGETVIVRYVVATDAGRRHLIRETIMGDENPAHLFQNVEMIAAGIEASKLTIMVDERTSGTAEALARVLQTNLKNVTVSGVATAGRCNIVTTKTFTADDTDYYVAVPSATILTGDKAAVALDSNGPVKQGLSFAHTIPAIGLLIFASVFGLLTLFKRSRKGMIAGSVAVVAVLVMIGYTVYAPTKNVKAQKAAEYINQVVMNSEDVRGINFLRFARVQRGQRDVQEGPSDVEKDVISATDLQSACKLVEATAAGDVAAFRKIIASYIYMPYARAQIGAALSHGMYESGVNYRFQWYGENFGVEHNDLIDGQFSVYFSPRDEAPTVSLQTQDPRYDQYATDKSELVTAEEVMRTISMGILRDATRRQKPNQ